MPKKTVEKTVVPPVVPSTPQVSTGPWQVRATARVHDIGQALAAAFQDTYPHPDAEQSAQLAAVLAVIRDLAIHAQPDGDKSVTVTASGPAGPSPINATFAVTVVAV